MSFDNVYGDSERAAAYARLEFPGTYYLAFRDLPEIIRRHVSSGAAIDFGCGTGRSTRFLSKLGFDVVGIDISEAMIAHARSQDPGGTYLLVQDGEPTGVEDGSLDLVLSAFTFDNIPTAESRLKNLIALRRLLRPGGSIVNMVSSPEIYCHEWASFTTAAYPENRQAVSGDEVRIVMKDVDDQRPVVDVLFTDESYRALYKEAALELVETCKPLACEDEPHEWLSETTVAPWVIYVLRKP